MIEQQGRVVAVIDGKAQVRLGGTSGCAKCDAGRGCGAGIFGRLLRRKPVTLDLDNTLNAGPGQPVLVGLPESLFLRLVARLYLLPLLAGLAGAGLGHYISTLGQLAGVRLDVITLLCGLASGAVTMIWINRNAVEFSGSVMVHLLRIIEFEEHET